ncbi:HAD family hydrolase [Bradyrhizobium guangzhouense]|uniref:HAD family hydrolase n=1 Tax=Bradyrhizobium guangzhouense TaxID=1325095 RepID=UPI001009CA51|nr:HAD family hydrolase [Bradyrhizobium guangzhouense]RXH10126.1 HAD family hydrolase [Bradyrhizobium guangzhouense]
MVDWDDIRLVVFDVDGTLYDQRTMRRRMLRELAKDATRTRSLTTLRTLRGYRRTRELLARQEVYDFERILIASTAKRYRLQEGEVRALAAEWLEKRPLAHIRDCRYPGVERLFAALRRRGKIIGVLSDYPAAEKLLAMELKADFVVSAVDRHVGIQKPNPKGLELLMQAAGTVPTSTVLIGDRPETDGEAARRAGAFALMRGNRKRGCASSFADYGAPVFDALLR